VASEVHPNRLAGETSPYLIQHAHNPVDWYPWGPEALARSKAEDKPILLSIGYAACHWCHVMEKESFEDEDTARLMNQLFVSIKVDREERPDLDAIYMDAVQAMTGHGGWPMTVFLTPDGVPFFAGTYFPREDRHGLPAFTKVLSAIADVWSTRREEVNQQGGRVLAAIENGFRPAERGQPLSEDVLVQAHAGLSRAFDPTWGGFGDAPKFPQPMTLEFLLRSHLRGRAGSLEMVERTLDRMAAGGIHDQLGGGFHRYSVDQRWHVPHFEKMLYDNAQLARVYVHGWQVTANDRYRRVAEDTLGYLLRELRHSEGGFFSSQDADSEGEEGRYFAWTWAELVDLAGEDLARAFGAEPGGNWEAGRNVLWLPEGESAPNGEARRQLFEARALRVKPATDDKVLAAWNGLAITALAEAGRAFNQQPYVDAAALAAQFVLANLRRRDGRLLRSWRQGRGSGLGYLDDYALMAEACLTLYETTFEQQWFQQAQSLADDMLALFGDRGGGGFFQTGSDAEALVVRPKELFDNALPSGNSAAATVLQRLAMLTGGVEYERAGVGALRVVGDLMVKAPTVLGQALSALDLSAGTSREVAIVGEPGAKDTNRLVREVHGRYLPNVVVAVGAPGVDPIIPLLADRPGIDGRATAYVCEGFACRMPVTDPAALAAQLTEAAAKA
jgi:uncharacterized protein YyaL (SSP411 family)